MNGNVKRLIRVPAALPLFLGIISTVLVSSAFAQPPDVGPGNLPKVILVRAFPQLTFKRPVGLTHAGDGSDRLFVIEQPGRVRVFQNRSDSSDAGVFLDIRPQVSRKQNEEGLLALAFHPDYENNGYCYLYYSAAEPRRGVLSRFSVSEDDPDQVDPDSEMILLEVEQPYGDQNGSTIVFGPEGHLYMSLGDGGAANDPHGNAQNLGTLLGTVLRLDVDHAEGDKPYAIPKDNPFVDRPGARGEIWAYGLRNIWRMSFDRETGDLWGGDVGQNLWEEIDLITKGGNYGWNIREGFHPFLERPVEDVLIDPIVEYSRSQGLSVVGGYVYRGKKIEKLVGAYIYADYVSGKIWALRYTDGKLVAHREIYTPSRRRYISSFGETEAGELYICVFNRLDARGSDKGRIYELRDR